MKDVYIVTWDNSGIVYFTIIPNKEIFNNFIEKEKFAIKNNMNFDAVIGKTQAEEFFKICKTVALLDSPESFLQNQNIKLIYKSNILGE